MRIEEFLSDFRNGRSVIGLNGDEDAFSENAEFVGDWLDENFEFPPYDADHFGNYFKSVKHGWEFVFCKMGSGYCPAANRGWLSRNGDPKIIPLSEVRRMIETASDPSLESAFEEVFV